MTLTLQIATQEISKWHPASRWCTTVTNLVTKRWAGQKIYFLGKAWTQRNTSRTDRRVIPVHPPSLLQERDGGTIKDHSTALSLSLSHTHTHFCRCRNKCILGSQHFMSAQKENGVTDVLPKPAATWILNFPYLNKSTDKLGLSIWT